MTTFDLPLPISTNALFLNKKGKGRTKTPQYRAWIEEAGWEIKRQHVPSFNGPVSLAYELSENARIDLDNLKCVADLLVNMGIIPNDSKAYVREYHMKWSSEVEGVRVTVSEV
jgi:Holliday junction resolvase RusA-like endonuclease